MRDKKNTKFHRAVVRFGRRNRFCRMLVLPGIAFWRLAVHVAGYFRDNGKRLGMVCMSFLLFAVYSSFSFPLFISAGETGSDSPNGEGQTSRTVSLAKETQINLEDMEILEDEDVLEGNEQLEISHGMSIGDKYQASEILEATPQRNSLSSDAQNDSTQGGGKTQPDEEQEYAFSKDDWRLVLINKQHSIPEDYTFTLGTIKGSMQCDERIIDDLLDMLQAAEEDGVDLMICSPYRDLEYQKMLFNRKIERYMNKGMSYMEAYQLSSQAVTVPGASEHQIGLALDIVCSTYMSLDEGFGDTEAGKWLAENSCRFGFILRYPKGKEYITGIEYEPWHFRYVGVKAAEVITKQCITLEEFWEEYLDNV